MVKTKMLVLSLLILLNVGCVSGMVQDVEDQLKLKWAEEWKPALLDEAKDSAYHAAELAVSQAVISLEKYKVETTGKLETIGVKVEEFDKDKDGSVSGAETLALLQEIKAKNDASSEPLTWWEILLAVGAAYVPLTGAKELAKKRVETRTLKAAA